MFLNESRARVAERCLRAYYIHFMASLDEGKLLPGGYGIRSLRQDKKLTWGTLLHAGLAAHYQNRYTGPALEQALLEEFPNWHSLDAETKNTWLEESEWIEKVIQRYAEWAAKEDNFHVEGVEQSGAVVLGDRCWQCGKPYATLGAWHGSPTCGTCGAEQHQFVFRLDLLVRDDYGFRVIDHKSTVDTVDEWMHLKYDIGSAAPQLWGYCYGAEKQSGQHIGGYSINIIRKVNAAGEAPDLTRSCPGCGRKKQKGCEQCNQTGRIPREERAADRPFHRLPFSFTPAKRENFITSRVRLCNKLVEHTRRLEEGDPSAFPHNPTSYGCDPTLCWGQRPGQPVWDIQVDDERWVAKGPDYVALKRLYMEEAA